MHFFCDESHYIISKMFTTFLTVLPRTRENQRMEASQEEDVDSEEATVCHAKTLYK